MRKREPKHPPRKWTADDEWCERTREMCARAMATWLKETVNTQRPIRSLTLAEMKNAVDNVIATYLIEESKREPVVYAVDDMTGAELLA